MIKELHASLVLRRLNTMQRRVNEAATRNAPHDPDSCPVCALKRAQVLARSIFGNGEEMPMPMPTGGDIPRH